MDLLLPGVGLLFLLALAFSMVLEGWSTRIREHEPKVKYVFGLGEGPRITVVVPVRDGADTIAPLLQDFYRQSYPKEQYEVIVVDDHSTDGTADIVRSMQRAWPGLRYEALGDTQGKKQGIVRGVKEATGEVILTTDADVRCGPAHLASLADHWSREKPDMVLMPVFTERGSGFLGLLQYHEQMAFQAATAGSAMEGRPLLANGANLVFTRKAFFENGGFHGDRWASGDDLFLLKRMLRAGRKVSYLRDIEAAVSVRPEPDLAAAFSQRMRWAGKMRAVRQVTGSLAAAVVVLFPWFLVGVTTVVVQQVQVGDRLVYTWALLIGAWLLWVVPIVRLSGTMAAFFAPLQRAEDRERPSWMHAAGAILSLLAFSVMAPIIAILSIFVHPTWKGRRI